MRDIRMILVELRGMIATGHFLRMVPLAFLAPMLSLWPYIGSAFAPAMIATLLVLEPFYNNTLNLWRGQLTASVVLPTDLVRTLRQRNAALIILTWSCAAFFVTVVSYVQPDPPPAARLASFALYLAAVQFPLLMLGNSISWQQIRVRSRWTLDDAAAAILMMTGAGALSVPPVLLAGLPGNEALLAMYSASTGAVWWRYSLPRTARAIHQRRADLWQQMHQT